MCHPILNISAWVGIAACNGSAPSRLPLHNDAADGQAIAASSQTTREKPQSSTTGADTTHALHTGTGSGATAAGATTRAFLESSTSGDVASGPRTIDGQIAANDNLSAILQRAGIPRSDIYAITRALATKADPETVRIGQPYRIVLDASGRCQRFEYEHRRLASVVVTRDEAQGFVAEEITREVQRDTVAYAGSVSQSLTEAVLRQGAHESLVSLLVDVFAHDINFFIDTRQGDRFRCLVTRVQSDNEFVRYERVLAAEYTGGVGTFQVFWWSPNKANNGRYVDEQGRGVARTLLKTPLKYARVSSEFNPKRMHPILHRVKGHNGVDFAAPTGTPVWAAATGKMVFRDRKGGAGNMVILSHANGMRTLYMHLDHFRKGQKVGDTIAQKTVIGYVGSTGLATGPHLHFAVTVGGRYVDPLSMKKHRGPGVPKGQRSRFRRERTRLLRALDRAHADTTSGAAAGPGDVTSSARG